MLYDVLFVLHFRYYTYSVHVTFTSNTVIERNLLRLYFGLYGLAEAHVSGKQAPVVLVVFSDRETSGGEAGEL